MSWPNLLLISNMVGLLTAKILSTTMGNDASCGRLHVRITVSPLILNGAAKYLEVSWDNASPLSGDWVGLFHHDPVYNGVNRALSATRVKSSSGWAVTRTRASDVMKTRPTWMVDMKDELSPMKLRKVFIPGAHDAGAYERYKGAETPVTKYSITQEEDVLSQLTYGIRYLDLRVGFYPFRNPVWWVNHGVVRLHPLQEFLDDVKKFVRSTQEIVLLDVHSFPVGFNYDSRVHQKLSSYLRQELGELATPTTLSWDSTLGEVWGSGRRLVLSYNKKEVVDGSDILWPAVAHKWGNVDSLDNLYYYLLRVDTSPPTNTSWSAMAELTANALKIALDSLGGRRNIKNTVNRNVTEWYRGDLGVNANIVAVDFFRGTAIVDAAIDWNSRRAGRMKCPNVLRSLRVKLAKPSVEGLKLAKGAQRNLRKVENLFLTCLWLRRQACYSSPVTSLVLTDSSHLTSYSLHLAVSQHQRSHGATVALVSERWCELAIEVPFVYPTCGRSKPLHRVEHSARLPSGDPPM
uniref:Phosphatidylinositol-specific phospholipase C X domain-containing protein n=1 Tax=Timema shepardi TaxID=629360 RepID=A0A7R9FX89_TIMSH|nr:unnamed protein product [Timema shepardi]